MNTLEDTERKRKRNILSHSAFFPYFKNFPEKYFAFCISLFSPQIFLYQDQVFKPQSCDFCDHAEDCELT